MKKYISTLLVAALLFNTASVFAGNSAGMKDVEITAQTSVATITPVTELYQTGEYMQPHVNNNAICDTEFEYKVNIKSRSGETEYFTINSSCGEKTYPPVEVTLAAGQVYEKNLVMEDILQGYQTFKVEVVNNRGEVVGKWSQEWPVVYPKVEGYLEKYTRKVGISGSISPQTTQWKWFNMLSGRTEKPWSTVEKVKGVYEVDAKHQKAIKTVLDDSADWAFILNYNNTLYSGKTGQNTVIETKENLDGFAEFSKHQAKSYPEHDWFEIWNEPNNAFRPNINYTYTAEVVKNELMKVNENAKTLIGSVAEGDYAYVMQVLDHGLWPNMDIVANHPYIRPSKVDLGYHNALSRMANVIVDAGGWRDQIITEVGWPTHTAGVSREQSAIEHAKQVVVADYYGVVSNQMYMGSDFTWAPNPNDSEANFGVLFDEQAKLKASAFTVKTVADMTAGSVFFGKMPFENKNIECYVYLADGEITAVMWANATGNEMEIEVKFDGESLKAWDMYGNPVKGTNTFTLKEAPIYIRGFNRKWLLEGLESNTRAYLDWHLNNAFMNGKEKAGWDKVVAIMEKSIDIAKSVPKDSFPTEEEAFGYLHKNYEVCYELIDAYNNNEFDISMNDLTGLLFANNWIANMWTALCILSVEDDDVSIKSRENITLTEEKMAEKAGEKTMSFSKAILDWSKKFSEKAIGVSELKGTNSMKNGVIKAWDMYATELAMLADKLCDIEIPGDDNVIIQLPTSQCSIKIGTYQDVLPSVYNYRKTKTLKGTIELLKPSGEVLGITEEFEVLPGESAQPEMTIFMNGFDDGDYKIRLIENGEVIRERKAHISAREVFDVKLGNINTVFENINSIKVEFTNKDDFDFEGKVTIEPICEWEFEDTEPALINAKVGESVSAEFKVKNKVKTNFNYYPFLVTVYNNDGGVVFKSKELLSFTVINKNNGKISIPDFEGDITGWEDAYPVYIQAPDEPESLDGWTDSDYHTRMLTKWDEKGIYMLFDIFDWYHENRQVGSALYNADSIQIGIDPLMDGTVPDNRYDADDYEYGFAYTEASGNTVYCWHDALNEGRGGDKPGEWLQFIRNEDLSHSRYLATVPTANLAPLSLSEGTDFRFNVLYNNTDVGTRSGWWQFTDGIANGKNPEYYWTFSLINDKTPYEKTVENPIPVVSKKSSFGESSQETETYDAITFNDIKGHWAENEIVTLAKTGILNGYEDGTFKPDNSISRVEFIHVLGMMNKWNIYDGQGVKNFDDVLRADWPMACRANKLGIVPTEMTPDNMLDPNKPITREEAFAILNRYYGTSGKNENYKPLYDFADCKEISDWAAGDVQNMYSNGFVQGDGARLNPKGNITRAEAVSILKRMYKF